MFNNFTKTIILFIFFAFYSKAFAQWESALIDSFTTSSIPVFEDLDDMSKRKKVTREELWNQCIRKDGEVIKREVQINQRFVKLSCTEGEKYVLRPAVKLISEDQFVCKPTKLSTNAGMNQIATAGNRGAHEGEYKCKYN